MTTRDPRHNRGADALPRDEALSSAYRELEDSARAGPPAALDARILAAAREAVAAPRRPARAPLPWWRRLVVPVSVAAVLLVSATLTLMVHDEQQKALAPAPAATPGAAPSGSATSTPQAPLLRQESDQRDQNRSTGASSNAPVAPELSNEAPAPVAPEPKAKAPAKRADESAKELRKIEAAPAADTAAARSAPARATLPTPAPFPPAAPAPATKPAAAPVEDGASAAGAAPGAAVGGALAPALPRREGEPRGRVLREAPQSREPAPFAPDAATPPPSGVSTEPAMRSRDASERESRSNLRLEQKADRSPQAWLEEIRELRRAGRDVEWREALERFRARYPDHPLPEDLR